MQKMSLYIHVVPWFVTEIAYPISMITKDPDQDIGCLVWYHRSTPALHRVHTDYRHPVRKQLLTRTMHAMPLCIATHPRHVV